MTYHSEKQLASMGFKSLGENVKISNKASIYNCESIEIGSNSRVDDFCILSGKIFIGKNVHIAPMCLLAGGQMGIRMEDFSGLAYKVLLFTQSDDYTGETMTNPTIDLKYKSETKKPINLGRHVIIGAASMIFPGVDIAEGCSVGAMSLVNKSTMPWGIYLGNPARRIKDRKKNLLELEKKFNEEMLND